ncbi:hypothetical protein C1632_13150 [Microbacterium testaceum]|nr:hypothetical protein C1632_13150 [Microbacterium testaceum]
MSWVRAAAASVFGGGVNAIRAQKRLLLGFLGADPGFGYTVVCEAPKRRGECRTRSHHAVTAAP